MKQTIGQHVYQFCKENGICTTCKIRAALPDNLKCAICAKRNVKYAVKSRKNKS